MAKCTACGKEMLTACGCDFKYVILRSKQKVKRFKVGTDDGVEPGQRCGDCGARYGHFHHPGCDMESCPICGCQLLCCDCDIEYFTTA